MTKKKLRKLLKKAQKKITRLETRVQVLDRRWRYYRDKDLEVQKIANLEKWIEKLKKDE